MTASSAFISTWPSAPRPSTICTREKKKKKIFEVSTTSPMCLKLMSQDGLVIWRIIASIATMKEGAKTVSLAFEKSPTHSAHCSLDCYWIKYEDRRRGEAERKEGWKKDGDKTEWGKEPLYSRKVTCEHSAEESDLWPHGCHGDN